jgi:hypothetical protein
MAVASALRELSISVSLHFSYILDPQECQLIIQEDHSREPLFIHSFIHSSMALQPFIRLWPFLQFANLFYTDGRTPWTSGQPVTRPLPTHRTTQIQNKRTHKHPCLEWDSNPRSQRSRERRQDTVWKYSQTSVHERLGSWTIRFTNKFSEHKASRITYCISSYEHASRQHRGAISWEYQRRQYS